MKYKIKKIEREVELDDELVSVNNIQSFSQALLGRLETIRELQNLVCSKLDGKDFNVFIFGSFLTERYRPGKSDIDIAFYSRNFDDYLDAAALMEDFFNERDIPQDIFFIDTRVPEPVFLAPLSSPVRFTDYFPEELKQFREECLEVQKRRLLE